MALVRQLKPMDRDQGVLHKPVEAKYGVFKQDDLAFVQIDTYGQVGRKIPGKTSQSIQFDEVSARQVVKILQQAFNIS